MNGSVKALVEKHFDVSGGKLLLGGIPASELAEKYGTPAFVYVGSVLDQKLATLRQAFPSRFSVFYSVKANPNPAILRHFVASGCGLEIASVGEFHQALRAGCEPRRMLFAGPGKTPAELKLTLAQGIGEIHVESLTELTRISDIGRWLGLRPPIALRVNPAAEAQGGAMRMGGRPAPFGVDEEVLEQVLERVLADKVLEFRGIHLFTGTQILDANILVNQYRHGIEVAKRVVNRIGRPLDTIDFGGGLGIPYFSHEKELDFEALRTSLAALFADLESDARFTGTRFLLEPGRFLVGESGIYIAQVNDIKISRGKKFLILDGGMNHHLAASGNLGQSIKRNFPVALLNRLDASDEETVDVVGPLCTPLDTLARGVVLPRAEVGDLFGIFQSGAYALSASPTGFLSHGAPAEVWISAGRDCLIRTQTDPAELALGMPRV
jgi:diaminopimelate decarboxylase